MVLFALFVPLLLLCLALVMERLEAPLREEAVSEEITEWLERAGPEEIEHFVSEGLSRPLNRYWRRRKNGPRGRVRWVIHHS